MNLLDIHQKVAKDVYPNGGTMICLQCKVAVDFSMKDAGHFLKYGWPLHCGLTMLFNKPRKVKK